METTVTIKWNSNYNDTESDIRKIVAKVAEKMAEETTGFAPERMETVGEFSLEVMTYDDEFIVKVNTEQKSPLRVA